MSNAGTAAHITAAAEGGPRYDKKLSKKERGSAENGIWCCRDHGKLIDDDSLFFSPEFLRAAKARA
ncbi:MAG: HNH endonuclease, partial [Kofleriaceae bacterium]